MKFGHLYDGNGNISQHADYIQFNICGLSSIEIVQRYFLYGINDKPMILLGDYTNESRDAREDDMLSAERIYEVKDAISSLRAFGANLLAITLHPVTRKGLHRFGVENVSFKQFIDKLTEIYQIPVLVKNRQYESLFLSDPEEIIDFSMTNKMTIDTMLLYEVCDHNRDYFIDVLSRIKKENIVELHARHVGIGKEDLIDFRNADDYNITIIEIIHHARKVKWVTFISVENSRQPQFELIVNRFKKLLDSSEGV